MAEQPSANAQLLEELEALSQTLYQSHVTSTARRTASLALPRSSVPPTADNNDDDDDDDDITTAIRDQKPRKPLARRMSLSPWRSRPKQQDPTDHDQPIQKSTAAANPFGDDASLSEKKKGIGILKNWKPIRALSHIGMQKISCLFSVEVVSVQGLPASMNGLRLSVCVRKKESKEGAVNTMPSRVSQGAADFEETLFLKCHVYSDPPPMIKLEPRPFLIYVFAVEASELDFGRSWVDLSRLIQESVEKSAQGTRIRQWDTSFNLSGKAKGGELVVKLGFQIMDKDGGVGIFYNSTTTNQKQPANYSSSVARKQSKTSFSVPSPKMSGRMQVWTPSFQAGNAAPDSIQGFEELNLDEEPSVHQPKQTESRQEDLDLPDFEVVDKGIEVQESSQEREEEEEDAKKADEDRSVSSEVVKEMVHDQFHLSRLSELDSIAQQIKALESMMGEEKLNIGGDNDEAHPQRLDAEEETVTIEFLQMLEDEEETSGMKQYVLNLKSEGEEANQSKVFLPDLGKGLGCVIQTRNGGYLAAMNPLDVRMARKDTPKLAVQISKPFILPPTTGSVSGFELFQRMAGVGFEELSSEVLTRMGIDEIMGKTPEQVAFEGIASAIIHGRSKEGASSSAARTVAAVKTMASALNQGRKERIATGLWNVGEDPVAADEILPFSMQKLESMSIDALKIQADMAEEDAPFNVSPINEKNPLAQAVEVEERMRKSNAKASSEEQVVTLAVIIQLHDPLRRYEVVGGPMVGLIQAQAIAADKHNEEDEKKFKVNSVHLGGMKVQRGGNRIAWDTEKQKLTALQWLVAYGLGKTGGRKGKPQPTKPQDLIWSLSSRLMADMWLKPIRNPDVKFAK